VLGAVGAKISGVHIVKNGMRMALVGGIAIAVGTMAGSLLPHIQ
jgi:VIT1/CCC1 family predicted Fe2+/Mn2+ transporter